jgi:uncharacterized SAM-binding protein YcdF (DUF218 family)
MFYAKKVIASLLLPPFGPLLLIALGLLLAARRPRLGKGLAWTGVLLAAATTLSPVDMLVAPLEEGPLFDAAAARGAGAVVILGGGRRSHAPEFGGETVNRLTLERLRYGARIARQTGLPVLLAGGTPRGEQPEALMMQDALERDFGLAARWLETASRDTRENALNSAELLKRDGVGRAVLVTHAMHMRRASAEFAAAGIEVVPAPTGMFTGPEPESSWQAGLPSPNSAYAAWMASHEWLGLAARALGL